MKDIPQEWIEKYIKSLNSLASQFPENDPMRILISQRIKHAMDMIEAFNMEESLNETKD